MNRIVRLWTSKIVAIPTIIIVILGIGDWTEKNILKSTQSDGWILVKAGIVLFHKEALILLIMGALLYDLFSKANRKRFFTEMEDLKTRKKSLYIAGPLLTGLVLASVLILGNGYSKARADINRLRNGKGFFKVIVAQRLINTGEKLYRDYNIPGALRCYKVADRLLEETELQSAIADLEKIPKLRSSLITQLTAARYSRAYRKAEAWAYRNGNKESQEMIKNIVISRLKERSYLCEELGAALKASEWTEARSILVKYENKGYSLGVQEMLLRELQDRRSFPARYANSKGNTWTDMVLASIVQENHSAERKIDEAYFSHDQNEIVSSNDYFRSVDEKEDDNDDAKAVDEVRADDSDTKDEDQSEKGDEQIHEEPIVPLGSESNRIDDMRKDDSISELQRKLKVRIRYITVDAEMPYGEFADKHGTTVEKLNTLNGLELSRMTVLAKGSELYVERP